MKIDPNTKISMLGVDGKLRSVPVYLKDKLLSEGWKIIVNAKEEYYPQHDRTLKNNIIGNDNALNPDSIESMGDTLEVERL